MTVLTKSLARSRGIVRTAHTSAVALKQAGGFAETMTPSSSMGTAFSEMRSQSKSRRRYAQFHGYVYSAVNALALEAAGQPVILGKNKAKGKKSRRPAGTKAMKALRKRALLGAKEAEDQYEIVEDHPILDALEKPNPVQGRMQFVYSFVSNLNLTGWAFVFGGQTEDGEWEFWSVPTTWVKPVHVEGPFAQFKLVNPDKPGSDEDSPTFDRTQVAFAYLPNPSDPMKAMSPADSQETALRIADYIDAATEQFFENGIFPSVVITIGKDPHPDVPGGGVRPRLTGAQRRQVNAVIRKVMGGVSNYNNPAIIDGLIERIDKFSQTQDEMGFDKSEARIKARILSAFCVHPFILGETVVGSYAAAKIVKERFYDRVNIFLSMLSNVMTNFVGSYREEQPKKKPKSAAADKTGLEIWWEPCEATDDSMYWSNIRAARSNNDISQNELRALLGFPPDEDRNESVVPSTSIAGIIQLLAQVGGGAIQVPQAQALLEGMGLPSDLAKKIAGKGAPPAPPAPKPGNTPPGGPASLQGAGNGEAPDSIPGAEEALLDAQGEMKQALRLLRMTPKEIAAAVDRASKQVASN